MGRKQNIDYNIHEFQRKDIRIILGNFDEDMARKVFCSATGQNMIGSKYVWIILSDYQHNWWNVEDKTLPCGPQQLKWALHGYLTTQILPVATQERLTIANLVSTNMHNFEFFLISEITFRRFSFFVFNLATKVS